MTQKSNERGQALILIALAAIGLFAFAALAIDGSRVFSDKRHAQNAADTAVLTAALTQIRTEDYDQAEVAAKARAQDNGYLTDWDNTIVDVDRCVLSEIIDINPNTLEPVPGDADAGGNPLPCTGVPTGKEAEYIRVKIISEIPATFGRVIGRETFQSAVQAVARVQGSSSTSTFPDDAIVTLRNEGCGICAGGDLELYVNGSGMFSNSTDSCNPPQHGSMDFDNGHGIIDSEGGFTMVAGAAMCTKPYPFSNVTGTPHLGQPITSLPFNIPTPTIACSADVYDDSDAVPDGTGALVYPPGTYPNKLTLDSTKLHKFVGNYCFGNDVIIKGDADVDIQNANFRLDSGSFDAGGGSGTGTFTCNNLLVYGAPGSDGIKFSGNGQVTCTGVTFFMESGDVTWNGNSNSDLKAPTSGLYKGLLMYLPASGGERTIKINGTSDNEIVGSIIAPASEVMLSGNSGSAGYNTQIISAYVTLQGNSLTTINFDPNVIYDPPQEPIITFDQ